MNRIITDLTYLITGTQSADYTKELKPYLLFAVLNTFGLIILKTGKIIFATSF